jgi:hypothetical protein
LDTSVIITYKDGSVETYASLEEASAKSGLSESAIKIRCNKSRDGSTNKKDKINCKWVSDTTFRSYQAKKSKSKGNKFELDIIKELTELGYKGLMSSRSQNRNLDNSKIDIAETIDKLPFYIQCKATLNTPNIETISNECPLKDKPLIIFWRKQKVNSISSDYVILPKEVLYNLLKNEKINN